MSENEIIISVAMPSYNSEKDIIKLLDSIKNQTYKNFEITRIKCLLLWLDIILSQKFIILTFKNEL